MNRIILTSFTSIDAPGGVPRWNRDFIRHFTKAIHYSWDDFVKNRGTDVNLHEWQKAKILNHWLLYNKLVDRDDIIVTDGFWGDGLFPDRTVSVAHGIWSHLTKDDVDAGKQPEFPLHHAVQVEYRTRHLEQGGRIVAVSDFIADQLKLQWNWDVPVINNAIDLCKFKPAQASNEKRKLGKPLIIHGVTTSNKGFDHIDAVKKLDAHVWLLDEAAERLGMEKYDALAQADFVVQPSAYEGNSFFVLEVLASGVPIVVYNVGLMYAVRKQHSSREFGRILDREARCPYVTAMGAEDLMYEIVRHGSHEMSVDARKLAEQYSVEKFGEQWESYLKGEFGDVVLQSR